MSIPNQDFHHGLLGLLIAIEPWVLAVVPSFAIPFALFQWRLAKQRYEERHARVTKQRWTDYYSGLVTGPYAVAETRLLGLGGLLVDRYRGITAEFRDRDRHLHKKNLWGSSAATLLISIVLYVLFARVALSAVTGVATIGDLAIFTGAAGRLRIALDNSIRSTFSAFEQTLHLANLEAFMAAKPKLRDGSADVAPSRGAAIRIEHVSFTYSGSTVPVLSDVSLEIRSGETLAIVGENGAGKSTLVKLLARLYDPDQGRILLDGTDLRDFALDDLHSRVSYVFQTFGRYEGTAAENIALGNWRELLDRSDRVAEVAKQAQIEGLIESLPNGYDTLLGRLFGEVTLSGGEWQQIAVARAFARKACLLVLDEPTASLDARAEFEVFKRFKSLTSARCLSRRRRSDGIQLRSGTEPGEDEVTATPTLHRGLRRLIPPKYRWAIFSAFLRLRTIRPEGRPESPEAPVYLIGFFSRISGVATVARIFGKHFEESGRRVTEIDMGRILDHGCPLPEVQPGMAPGEFRRRSDLFGPGTIVVVMDAPYAALPLLLLGGRFRRSKRLIALWFWELPDMPRTWRWSARCFDEILTCSEFNLNAVKALTDRCRLVPAPIGAPVVRTRGFGEDKFRVLYLFNMSANFARKNPLAVVDAFLKAFGSDERTELIIKLTEGKLYPEGLARLRSAMGRSANLILIEGDLPDADLGDLFDRSDVYLSLHRSEGLGLPPLEAIRRGLFVVATGWSGNVDFMRDRERCLLVPYRLVPVEDPQGSYPSGGRWAEPDTDAAAALLREIVASHSLPQERRDSSPRRVQPDSGSS